MTDAVELVIFDCDGVLVDSETLAIQVEARLLASLGWAIEEAEILERFVGRSDAHMLQEIEHELGRPMPEWQGLYEKALEAAFRSELKPVPGIESALANLEVPCCIASSGSHEKMKLTLGLTGLLPHFDRIYSATEVSNGKPAPDLFLHAAAQCGVEPSQCVVVEDSRSGVLAARAAGMRVLGYGGGPTPATWLEGADTIVFTDMSTVPALVNELRHGTS